MTLAAASLFSPHWYRIGPLRPRLVPGVRVRRQRIRSEDWFVLTHPVDQRHHRINRNAYEVVGRLDGRQSLDAVWNGLQQLLGDALPTQDEVTGLMARLSEVGLVQFDVEPDWSLLRRDQTARERRMKAGTGPFAFRLRLFDPAPLLARLAGVQRIAFHPLALAGYVLLLLAGLVQAVTDWSAIRAYATLNLLTPGFLILAWLVYPFVKALHELGHAFVARRWGGEVREAGIAFMLFMPMPYVDASAASAFPYKWQRAAVSSAGILVELLLAAGALSVWRLVEDGLVRELAFAVMVIGGFSTIVFNANPLLRFDGYYILTDVLELPNLAARSQRWWGRRLAALVLGRAEGQAEMLRGDERIWIPAYAPASWIYRLGVSLLIVHWLAQVSPWLGLAAVAWLVCVLFCKPLLAAAHALLAPAHPGAGLSMLRAAGMAALLAACVLWVPVPVSTVAPALVWMPEHAQVRTESGGRVVAVLARDGEQVAAGQALIRMEEPALAARETALLAAIAAAEAERAAGWQKTGLRGRNAGEELARLHAELSQLRRQLDQLTLRAGTDGVFVLPRAEELLQRDLPQGALVAYVLPPGPATVRATVAQDDIGLVRSGVRDVSVWLAEAQGKVFDARVLRVEPAASPRLPARALGDKGGGPLATDPAEPESLTLLDPVFLVDLSLAGRATLRVGGRAWVRFEHEPRALAEILLLRLRQLFLRAFDARIA